MAATISRRPFAQPFPPFLRRSGGGGGGESQPRSLLTGEGPPLQGYKYKGADQTTPHYTSNTLIMRNLVFIRWVIVKALCMLPILNLVTYSGAWRCSQILEQIHFYKQSMTVLAYLIILVLIIVKSYLTILVLIIVKSFLTILVLIIVKSFLTILVLIIVKSYLTILVLIIVKSFLTMIVLIIVKSFLTMIALIIVKSYLTILVLIIVKPFLQ